MKKISFNSTLAGGVGLLMLLPGLASAATIVTDWSFEVDSTFTAATLTDGSSLPVPSTTLAWGDPAPPNTEQSSLIIDPSNTTGSVDTLIGGGTPTGTQIGTGSTLTHNNFPIFAPSLASATLSSTLTLVATSPSTPGAPGALPPLEIDISFSETPNVTPCADPSSPTPCNDIFVLDTGLLNTSFLYDVDGSGAVEYFINIFPLVGSDLVAITDPNICGATGASAPCLGFSTVEGQSNEVTFGFSISTERLSLVPTPVPLALLGAGLFGVGLVRSRKIKAAH